RPKPNGFNGAAVSHCGKGRPFSARGLAFCAASMGPQYLTAERFAPIASIITPESKLQWGRSISLRKGTATYTRRLSARSFNGAAVSHCGKVHPPGHQRPDNLRFNGAAVSHCGKAADRDYGPGEPQASMGPQY